MPVKFIKKAKIGVLGASGYTGSELVRLLLRHPHVELALLTADRRAGQAMAAVFLDLMVRLKQEKTFKPSRDLKMALTCGEETSRLTNGADYLLQHNRALVDAAFAINEGAGGLLSEAGSEPSRARMCGPSWPSGASRACSRNSAAAPSTSCNSDARLKRGRLRLSRTLRFPVKIASSGGGAADRTASMCSTAAAC